MEERELWSVVCTDFHRCIGPFPSVVAATMVANQMTNPKQGCVYVPVPMEFIGVMVKFEDQEQMQSEVSEMVRRTRSKRGDKSEKDRHYGGQYL